jgi:hypothetical protein
MGVAGAVEGEIGVRRRAADGAEKANPLAAPAELEVDPVLDPALGQAGVDVVRVEAAEHFLGRGRASGKNGHGHRRIEQDLHGTEQSICAAGGSGAEPPPRSVVGGP